MKSFKIEIKTFKQLKESGNVDKNGVLHLQPLKDVAKVAILDEFECSLTNDECKRVRAGEIVAFNRAGRSYIAKLDNNNNIVVYHSYDTMCDYAIVGQEIIKVQFDN